MSHSRKRPDGCTKQLFFNPVKGAPKTFFVADTLNTARTIAPAADPANVLFMFGKLGRKETTAVLRQFGPRWVTRGGNVFYA